MIRGFTVPLRVTTDRLNVFLTYEATESLVSILPVSTINGGSSAALDGNCREFCTLKLTLSGQTFCIQALCVYNPQHVHKQYFLP